MNVCVCKGKNNNEMHLNSISLSRRITLNSYLYPHYHSLLEENMRRPFLL